MTATNMAGDDEPGITVDAALQAGPGWPPGDCPDGPLAGIRVLDLSRVLAGPFATMVLGDLGADVLKVERPGRGDDTRHWGPPFHGDDAAYFLSVNRNRRSLTLDLGDELGRAIVRRLVAKADVVVENFLPRHLVSLRLQSLRDDPDGPVWIAIRGANSTGPDGERPGYDAMVQARSGLMSITGEVGGQPLKVGVAIADVVTGLYAAVSALAGLVARSRGGRLGTVEVPLLEAAVSALVNQAANHLIGGEVPRPAGNEHPNISPYGPLRAADGLLMVGAGNDVQFRRLCTVLGRTELSDDPRFASNADRVAHREQLHSLLEATFVERSRATWIPLLEQAGVPFAPIQSLDEVFSDPHVKSVALVEEMDHPAGPLPQVRSPLLLDGERAPLHRSPPTVGQHTDEVLLGLGLDPATVRRLRDRGVC